MLLSAVRNRSNWGYWNAHSYSIIFTVLRAILKEHLAISFSVLPLLN